MRFLPLLALLFAGCASTRIEGGIEYQGQHGVYRVSYDGKTIRPVIVLGKGFAK